MLIKSTNTENRLEVHRRGRRAGSKLLYLVSLGGDINVLELEMVITLNV